MIHSHGDGQSIYLIRKCTYPDTTKKSVLRCVHLTCRGRMSGWRWRIPAGGRPGAVRGARGCASARWAAAAARGMGSYCLKYFYVSIKYFFPLTAHLASGDRGMWPTDFRLEGEWRFLVLMCSLCLSPCRELGRGEDTAPEEEPEYCHLLLIKALSRKNI